jgi:hypothetical protein
MRIIATLMIVGCFAVGCAISPSAESRCIFSNKTVDCKSFSLCEDIFNGLQVKHKNHIDISKRILPEDFTILLSMIKSGDRCAQRLGFTVFGVALKGSAAGYMEDLSIALSYSIEKNPTAFLQELPDNFLDHRDILNSLSCGIYEQYTENTEYIKIRLQKRLKQIDSVKNANLSSRKEKISSLIQNCINDYYQ